MKDLQGAIGYSASVKKSNDFVAHPVAIDEDADVTDIVQLAVFIRGINEDCHLTVELLDLDPKKGKTGCEEFFLDL